MLGLVVLAEELRPNIGDTIGFLREQGSKLKVLSGDAPATVAAIAGMPDCKSTPWRTAAACPDDAQELAACARRVNVVGRISPEGKRAIVEALRDAGRYVAMVGDGVNDVPALKASRLALAQGTGAQMAKSVADLVLVQGDFAAVPAMVDEGRQTLRNLQRVAKLYVTKSSFAAFLILLIGTTSTAYPLLPRHFSLAASLTDRDSLLLPRARPEPRPLERARLRTRRRSLRGAHRVHHRRRRARQLPLRALRPRPSVRESRTVATTVLVGVGLYLILVLEAANWHAARRSAALPGPRGHLRTRTPAPSHAQLLRARAPWARWMADGRRRSRARRARALAHRRALRAGRRAAGRVTSGRSRCREGRRTSRPRRP